MSLRELPERVPDDVSVFLDNVGGEILDAVLTRLVRGARIVLSGGVSQYAYQTFPIHFVQCSILGGLRRWAGEGDVRLRPGGTGAEGFHTGPLTFQWERSQHRGHEARGCGAASR